MIACQKMVDGYERCNLECYFINSALKVCELMDRSTEIYQTIIDGIQYRFEVYYLNFNWFAVAYIDCDRFVRETRGFSAEQAALNLVKLLEK